MLHEHLQGDVVGEHGRAALLKLQVISVSPNEGNLRTDSKSVMLERTGAGQPKLFSQALSG